MKVLLFVALLIAVAMAERRLPQTKEVHRNGHHYDHTLVHLPDLHSESGMKEMRCSTCVELASHIWSGLHPVIKEQTASTRPARRHKYTTVVENACTHIDNKFGLLLNDEGKATHSMSGDASYERLRGLWVNRFVKGACARIVNKWEEHIVHNVLEYKDERDFSDRLCMNWEKACQN